jgi:hypothetical protein
MKASFLDFGTKNTKANAFIFIPEQMKLNRKHISWPFKEDKNKRKSVNVFKTNEWKTKQFVFYF